ncbi:TlpA disulfide reductase family protein [Aliikangiella maris]|uniref:TlpA disulfide reductase family protein n=2 Tax=Aliikangiella maris TaxID=3162458 RepID=A0ABV3MJA5_9GAMM
MSIKNKKVSLRQLMPIIVILVLGVLLVCIAMINGVNQGQLDFEDSEHNQIFSRSAADYPGFDWQLTSLKNEVVRLSDFQGQPVLLVFWATWCPYCKQLLPGIEKLHEQYAHQGLKIIGVNINEDWKPHVYWENHGYQFDSVLEGDEIARHYGVAGTPTVVFIAPSGKVMGVKAFHDPKNPLLEKFANAFTKN